MTVEECPSGADPTRLKPHERRRVNELARIVPCLREPDDRERTSEEREFLAAMARLAGRPLTPRTS